MRCVLCGSFTRVVDSRIKCATGTMVSEFRKYGHLANGEPCRLRKRQCRKGHLTVTIEVNVIHIESIVMKDGEKEG